MVLKGIPLKIQKKLVRQVLRKIGKEILQKMRANVTWNDPKFRRMLKVKIKTYKRGRYIWMGVGALKGFGGEDWKQLVKAHAYNSGWMPYPKGRPTNRKGKNWRKGLRKIQAPKVWITQWRDKALLAFKQSSRSDVFQALIDIVHETGSNNNGR